MKVIEIRDTFGVDSLKLVERPDLVPGPGQVVLKMKAFSINYRDLAGRVASEKMLSPEGIDLPETLNRLTLVLESSDSTVNPTVLSGPPRQSQLLKSQGTPKIAAVSFFASTKHASARLPASGVTIHYRDSKDVEDVVVAFRPGGGLMYTARLGTLAARYERDRKRFIDVLRSFRLEPWR